MTGFSGGAARECDGGGRRNNEAGPGDRVRPAGVTWPEFKKPESRPSALGLQSLGQTKKREEN
jgi:hypothetical protein